MEVPRLKHCPRRAQACSSAADTALLCCFGFPHNPPSYFLIFQDFSVSERILGRNKHHVAHRADPGHPR